MTTPIDPIRRAERIRRAKRALVERGETTEAAQTLPVPVSKAPVPKPAIGVEVQLIGEGERRGLRGGEPVLKAAKTAYVRTEWSGSADRRTPKGSLTKKEV
ncbi:hypothetical protein [Phenylobacterium sp.]|jgi:hypothetical protein|uniref:hypothetical protein n=1 Tax=Phenylobacterium sp. TaxID=1871053 RepID=UPI002E320EA0|nr:hypothetical protein [Phenylobacterium sp.]HEX2561592.1 hypothetical protein [Phenylobacterium sp.]